MYENEKPSFKASIDHTGEELGRFNSVSDQHTFRVDVIQKELEKAGVDLKTLDAVVGRGGLLKPIPSGTYRVDNAMLTDLSGEERGEHASNLGGIIAHDIADSVGIPAFIVDPVVVDEMEEVARYSGMPELERRSIFHALNQKAVARRASQDMGKNYRDVNLIVGHLGGGISVGAHRKGRVVDVNNAFNGDGPFAPERSGGLPAGQLAELCFSGQFTLEDLKKRITGNAGVKAYLGTHDMRDVKTKIDEGDARSEAVYKAMAYQVAKEIGSCAAVLDGKVDGIVLSGGLVNDDDFVKLIRDKVSWIAPLFLYPGEEEMLSLALGALRVLTGEEKAKTY
jgi:butyrate kinase